MTSKETKIGDITDIGGVVVVGDNNDIIIVSTNDIKQNSSFVEFKNKLFHHKGSDLIIQLREPPENEEIIETITDTVNLIPRLEKWLFIDKRLSLVCISNDENLTYSFI